MSIPLPRRALASALGAVLVVTGVAACTGPKPQPDRQAAQAFLTAVAKRDAASAAATTSDPAAATTLLTRSFAGLGPPATTRFDLTSMADRKDTTSTARYHATWTWPGVPAWSYDGALSMTKQNQTWRVAWSPSALAPKLTAGHHLALVRTQPTRAALLDRAGHALFTRQPVVDVSIDPAKVTNLRSLAATLASVLQVSAADVVRDVQATPKGQATPVVTLREAGYARVKRRIYDLPGTQFARRTALLAPTSRFAQPLLGQIGEPTKEIIDQSKGAIVAGDVTGLSGLQRALNAKLAGTPGYRVQSVRDAGSGGATVLASLRPPAPSAPITLTLDRADQTTADAALAAVTLPASIVVTQPSTGRVLAVANSAAANGDIALTGQYPPGSTFKISTYTAAFTADPSRSPSTMADCPGTLTVNGQTVRNENSFVKGRVPLSDAFAFSCNTTAATLGLALPKGALVAASRSLGLGQDWHLPVDAFAGSFPPPTTPNETAAAAYGQGKVLVSPLLMAEIAGAAASGRPVAPSLVVGAQATPGPAAPARVTQYLNALMRDVVTVPGATGRALAALPGPVEGKTGTAEFGTAVPPRSHSWFAGTRGDLAVCVFVYGGENSDTGAVPLAATLLRSLG